MTHSKLSRIAAGIAATLGLFAAAAGIATADATPNQPGGPIAGQQCPPPPGDSQGQPPQGEQPQGQPPQGQPPQGQPPQGQPPEGQPPQCPTA